MNRNRVYLPFAIGVIAALLVAAWPAGAGKPGGGGGSVNCADGSQDWNGFPAYAYVVNTLANKSWTYEIRVASRNGLCSRRVGTALAGRASTASFAWNGSRYLIVWYAGTGLMLAKFEPPTAGSATTPINAEVSLFRPGPVAGDISPDGLRLAYLYGSEQLHPSRQVRIASLADVSGDLDTVLHTYQGDGLERQVWWSPWGKIYFRGSDSVNGKRLLAIDPDLGGSQAPEVVLQLPAAAPLQVGALFDFWMISGGYAGLARNLVVQGYFTTGVKSGGRTGSWCVAAYSLDADTHSFTIGTATVPSPLVGFEPSVTGFGTVLLQGSTDPQPGSSCSRTGYVKEAALADGFAPSIAGQVRGEFPVALKSL